MLVARIGQFRDVLRDHVDIHPSISQGPKDRYDISGNSLTPSPAKTRILEQLKPEQLSQMLGKVPRGRRVAVEEAAAMIACMVSDESSFTTGATFDLSGGCTTY
jgi:NAD(P)-dependent dehydrogenase (short-subunit alcohol dehydrogenase family)